ncbi:MAG: LytR C-terminal domain-containing protein [Lachnospiraceae bacterium]|nr:LytR C-terminal domain-containing protein [Lachnospiraceae bacterium]
MKKNRKKKVGKIFLRVFLKSCVCIGLFCLVCGISYKVTMFYYENVAEVEGNPNLYGLLEKIEADGKAETISKNLILVTGEDDEQIKNILIEIFNNTTGNLDYITVPKNLEFTMSYELYKKLATVNGDIPQIIRMGKIHKYFQGEGMYQCAQILLEDLLDISFSYYTVIPINVYKEMFVKEKGSGMQIWKDSYKKQMLQLTTKEKYEEFFKKYCDKVKSNLSYEKKCNYISGYLAGGPKQVVFYKVSGENVGNVFSIAVEETNSLIHQVLSNAAYTEGQKVKHNNKSKVSSVGLPVEILNSTKVNGLASAFQNKLAEQGMNVIRIGNYTGNTLEKTKIIVKEDGYGQDLLDYFKDAEIEVGTLSKDVEIRIILGNRDGEEM